MDFYALNVFVVDRNGQAIPNALVEYRSGDELVASSTTTGTINTPVKIQVPKAFEEITVTVKYKKQSLTKTVPANANNVTFEFKKVIIKGDSGGANMPAAISIPLEVLREAIRAVPAVKYALGIAGIIAVIAIVKGFNLDFRIAGFGTIIMLLLMTVLVVFARLTKTAPGPFVVPVAIFTWFAISMTMTVATLLLTSVFWQKPVDLQDWIVKKRVPDPLLPQKGESLAQYLSNGRVVSLEWSKEIPTAVWETGSLYRVWYNAGSKTWWATGKLNTQNGGQFRQGSDAATTCPQSPVLTGSHPIATCFSPEDHKIVIWQGDYDFDESGNVLKGQEVVGHIARTN
jgi:hypothetical protein